MPYPTYIILDLIPHFILYYEWHSILLTDCDGVEIGIDGGDKAYMVNMDLVVNGRYTIGMTGVGCSLQTGMGRPIPQVQKSENWVENRPEFRDSEGAR